MTAPHRVTFRVYRILLLSIFFLIEHLAAAPNPAPQMPGSALTPPERPTAPGAPLIYEHSGEAGPDETLYLVGDGLTDALFAWGVSEKHPGGEEIKLRVQWSTPNQVAVTIPEKAHDGPILIWAKNEAGFSDPIVLNTPQPWWCIFDDQAKMLRVFGRNLSERPDFTAAHAYLCRPGQKGFWAKVQKKGKYEIACHLPESQEPGEYQIWLHAGTGGSLGWGEPLTIQIPASVEQQGKISSLQPGDDLQAAIDAAGAASGGEVTLPAGDFTFTGTLRIPAGVTLSGQSKEATRIRSLSPGGSIELNFPRLGGVGWDQSVASIHTVGDTIEYQIDVPKSGEWTVWLRYATEMSPWKLAGVSGKMTLSSGKADPVPLMNLDNTGSFGIFRWSRSATMHLEAGKQTLTWKNVGGGGISLDAFVFSLDPQLSLDQDSRPISDDGLIVLQGEDCTRFESKEGVLPSADRAAVWLTGDGASVRDLTILGNAQVNVGIAVRSADPLKWVSDCKIDRVLVSECDGKHRENCGVLLRYADHARVADSELWGRSPIFLSGIRRSIIRANHLTSVTRFGGNAEAAIQGRTETIEECVIENNRVVSPPGAEAGGPTARRLIWLSTGHGSITHNWIAGNQSGGDAEQAGGPRFGGVAGTEQNVGEMILFEGNHRTMFFGALVGADEKSVTLPKTLLPTPEERLGSVKREQLAHDDQGNETPYWPPDTDDGSPEPPISEYYVSVMSGRGQGQSRRVLRREGERLILDHPWRVAPEAGSLVTISVSFYRNLITGNSCQDGMTGIQLWISCIENVVAGNTIARQRKPGLFFYANATTLASSMPRTWNRGISPLFWNIAEGNRADECSAGALITSGDGVGLPIEFPRALGNVLRHNSFLRSRTEGVILSSRKAMGKTESGDGDTAASIAGTIVEFNVVRDAVTAYRSANHSDAVVFRRNHAYFWYPVNLSTAPSVAFRVDEPGRKVAIELNSIEGINGVPDPKIIELQTPEP